MDITIKKIKAAKGKLVFEYDKKEEGNTPISTHKSTFKEEPEPSFWEAFAALCVDICRVLELAPGQYATRVEPTGVTFSEDSSGCDCAIITCEYSMLQSMTTTTINTPLFRFAQSEEELGRTGYFDEDTEEHLITLQNEAVRYLEGHRGQGSLFDDEEQESAQTEDSPVRLVAMGHNGTNNRQIAG